MTSQLLYCPRTIPGAAAAFRRHIESAIVAALTLGTSSLSLRISGPVSLVSSWASG